MPRRNSRVNPLNPPYYCLIVGVRLFLAAAVSTLTGKTYGRYIGFASRAKAYRHMGENH